MDESARTDHQRRWFVFSFGECDSWPNPDDKYHAFASHVREREWNQEHLAADDLLQHYSPEMWMWSVADLAAVVRKNWLSDPDMPNEVVEVPFAKLASLMDCRGWVFVGGVFLEGEGQQPDTSIEVVLESQIHRVMLNPSWLTSTVTSLAQAAYDEPGAPGGEVDRTRLAVLADALEETGCTERTVLEHLRGSGRHVRDCWALALLLAKE